MTAAPRRFLSADAGWNLIDAPLPRCAGSRIDPASGSRPAGDAPWPNDGIPVAQRRQRETHRVKSPKGCQWRGRIGVVDFALPAVPHAAGISGAGPPL